MTAPARTRLTPDDLAALPDDGPNQYELIDGELVEMPPCDWESSALAGRFVMSLGAHVVPRHLGIVTIADGGYVVGEDPYQVMAPDVAFVRAEHIAARGMEHPYPRLVPDLVVEVISPSDRAGAIAARVARWLAFGVRLLWLVDPDERTVTVYAPGKVPRSLTTADTLDGGAVLPELRLPLADIFG